MIVSINPAIDSHVDSDTMFNIQHRLLKHMQGLGALDRLVGTKAVHFGITCSFHTLLFSSSCYELCSFSVDCLFAAVN